MTPDNFWLRAFRNAYESVPQGPDLWPIEKMALLDLCEQAADQGTDDRYWAGIGILRDDMAMQIVPLTIDRVEDTARLYAQRRYSESFTLTPPQDSGS